MKKSLFDANAHRTTRQNMDALMCVDDSARKKAGLLVVAMTELGQAIRLAVAQNKSS